MFRDRECNIITPWRATHPPPTRTLMFLFFHLSFLSHYFLALSRPPSPSLSAPLRVLLCSITRARCHSLRVCGGGGESSKERCAVAVQAKNVMCGLWSPFHWTTTPFIPLKGCSKIRKINTQKLKEHHVIGLFTTLNWGSQGARKRFAKDRYDENAFRVLYS